MTFCDFSEGLMEAGGRKRRKRKAEDGKDIVMRRIYFSPSRYMLGVSYYALDV